MNGINRAEYLLFRLAIGGLAALPTPWGESLCREAGRLVGPGLGVRREVVRRQLTAVYPKRSPQEIDGLVAAVYRHLGQTVAETFCTDPRQLAARVRIEPGWGPLDAVMSAGLGVLAVTAHLGNFELGGRILAARYPVLDVIKPMRNNLFGQYLARDRARHGIQTVPMAQSGRAVVAHLRGGGMVTLLLDQDAGREGVRTDFLGLPASTWPGAARLAVRTGTPVVPLAILRSPDGEHILHIGRVIDLQGATDNDEDIARLTARISAAVEVFIREYPEQWFWVHRRWKGAAEAKVTHAAE